MEVTEGALEMLAKAVSSGESDDGAVRLVARQSGAIRFRYQMSLETAADAKEDDSVLEMDGVTLRADPESAKHLDGVKLDYVDEGEGGAGFKFHNPREEKGWDDPVAQRFQEILDDEINPQIASHGGYIDLVDYKDGKAYVTMGGGCQGCGMAKVTLSQGIETAITNAVPEIERVVDVTDHASGENPYYQAAKK